ncbi:MAG: hypothetical protein HZA88_18380 [Verrucomicrobia bacterium]|nr:hypothetical protein [Verrucomicrobiota bacterium]
MNQTESDVSPNTSPGSVLASKFDDLATAALNADLRNAVAIALENDFRLVAFVGSLAGVDGF